MNRTIWIHIGTTGFFHLNGKRSRSTILPWLPHRLWKRQSQTTVFLRTPITQMIFFNQGIVILVKCTYNMNGTDQKRQNLCWNFTDNEGISWMNLIVAFEKGLKISDLNGDSNPDLCDTAAVLHQLSYRANWELVVMWVDFKPVDVEIEDVNKRIFLVFERQVRCCLSSDKMRRSNSFTPIRISNTRKFLVWTSSKGVHLSIFNTNSAPGYMAIILSELTCFLVNLGELWGWF